MPRVRVNNVEVEVSEGSYIVDAVLKAGFAVPLLCYLQGIFSEATCRICVVKADGRVVPACRFPVRDGMNISTEDPEIERTRRLNFELLLATHRVECWNCIRKGSCTLAFLSRELGVEGLPVCSECPLVGEYCYVKRGLPCLGPVTVSGCEAECPRQGAPCTGCRGYLVRTSTWIAALEYYRESGIEERDLEAFMSMFWPKLPEEVERIIRGGSKQ